jgi:serine/threonine protein kinase
VLVDIAGYARLTDFGLALLTNATVAASGLAYGGTIRWMAPELLQPEEDDCEVNQGNEGNPTKESDLYSLAMTAWEVRLPCTGTLRCTDLVTDLHWQDTIQSSSQRCYSHHKSTGWRTASAANGLYLKGFGRRYVDTSSLLVGSVSIGTPSYVEDVGSCDGSCTRRQR